jgi:hypothetical protein
MNHGTARTLGVIQGSTRAESPLACVADTIGVVAPAKDPCSPLAPVADPGRTVRVTTAQYPPVAKGVQPPVPTLVATMGSTSWLPATNVTL